METNIEIFDKPPEEIEQYDLSLVFPVDTETFELYPEDETIVKKCMLTLGRKYIYLCYSSNDAFIFMLIRAGLKLLKLEAEKYKWKFLLDREVIRDIAETGNEEHLVNPIYIPHDPNVSLLGPYEYMYCNYTADPDIQDLYYRTADMTHPFRKSIRIKMLMHILANASLAEIKSPLEDDNRGSSRNSVDDNDNDSNENQEQVINVLKTLNLDHLHKSGTVLEYFPIHDLDARDLLAKDWIGLNHVFAPCLGLRFPQERARDYLGEKVAIYFIFLRFLCRWLVLPTLIGIAFEVMSLYYWNTSRPETPVFAFFILLWFITMMEYWKYEFAILCLKWNLNDTSTSQHAENQSARYAFYGDIVPSFINGKDILYFSKYKRMGYYFVSTVVCAIFLALTIAGICGIYYARYVLVTTKVTHQLEWVVSAMIALQIWVFNLIYYYLAIFLTESENHRTDCEFSNALIVKLFIYGFINMTITFYYLAFKCPLQNIFDYSTRESPSTNCMNALAVNIIVIIGAQSFFSVLCEFILPHCARFICNWWTGEIVFRRKRKYKKDSDDGSRSREFRDTFYAVGDDNDSYSRDRDENSIQLESVYSGTQDEEHKDYQNPVGRSKSFSPTKASYKLLESYTAKFNQYTHLVYLYNKLYMMFAVIVVFGSVLPGVFLVVLLTLCFYIQGYGYQLLYQYQRLIPSEDLNTHNIHIFFEVLGLIAIISTSPLILFTMNTIHVEPTLNLSYKLCIIIGIILAVSTYRYSLSKYLEGVIAEEVTIHEQRNEFLVDKLIDRIPDRAENFHLDIL